MAGQCAGITKRDRTGCDRLYRIGSQTGDRGTSPLGELKEEMRTHTQSRPVINCGNGNAQQVHNLLWLIPFTSRLVLTLPQGGSLSLVQSKRGMLSCRWPDGMGCCSVSHRTALDEIKPARAEPPISLLTSLNEARAIMYYSVHEEDLPAQKLRRLLYLSTAISSNKSTFPARTVNPGPMHQHDIPNAMRLGLG
jgi:hypothetical protein